MSRKMSLMMCVLPLLDGSCQNVNAILLQVLSIIRDKCTQTSKCAPHAPLLLVLLPAQLPPLYSTLSRLPASALFVLCLKFKSPLPSFFEYNLHPFPDLPAPCFRLPPTLNLPPPVHPSTVTDTTWPSHLPEPTRL